MFWTTVPEASINKDCGNNRSVQRATFAIRIFYPAATDEWLIERPDETLFLDDDPHGPNELAVPAKAIDAVLELLMRVAQHTNFKARARGRN